MSRLIYFILPLFICCGEASDKSENSVTTVSSGEKIYRENCSICHGGDGKLGSGGAKDLSKSNISLEMSKAIIRDGKGAMTSFKALLNEEEIHKVAAYIEELRKK